MDTVTRLVCCSTIAVITSAFAGCDCGAGIGASYCREGTRRCDKDVILQCFNGEWTVLEDCNMNESVCIETDADAYCATGTDADETWETGERAGIEPDADTEGEDDEEETSVVIVSRVSAGNRHTCAVHDDGSLWCWGANDRGQLGNGTVKAQTGPVRLDDTGPWRTVATGEAHTCGLKDDGSLWCWGANDRGQLGDKTFEDRPSPVEIGESEQWISVSAGRAHTCGIGVNGFLFCWGANDQGQLGDMDKEDRNEPTQVSPPLYWREVSAGIDYTCGVTPKNEIWCWGGQYRPSHFSVLVRVNSEQDWKHAYASGAVTYGMKNNGTLWRWNWSNEEYERLNMDTDWLDCSIGYRLACGIKTDGTLWCWGADSGYPYKIEGDLRWTQVSTGWNHRCAIDDMGRLWCWGDNLYGQVNPYKPGGNRLSPTKVQTKGKWEQVAVGKYFSCGIEKDGTLWCWGDTMYKPSEDRFESTARTAPQAIDHETKWIDVAAGKAHACALDVNGKLFCWGYNRYGQLGTGDPDGSHLPVQVRGGKVWTAVGAGGDFTCGLDFFGKLFCWGNNEQYQLGSAGDSRTQEPYPADTDETWIAIELGTNTGCGLVPNQRLFCWGCNMFGQRGDGTTDYGVEPTKVKGDHKWKSFSTGDVFTCGVEMDGTLWCWGKYKKESGWVTDYAKEPVQVGGENDWHLVSVGMYGENHPTVCAIKEDATLWCWGENQAGQVGNGSTLEQPDPVLIGHGWKKVEVGSYHTCGIKLDGSIWCWGDNRSGQIGDGSAWFDDPILFKWPDD